MKLKKDKKNLVFRIARIAVCIMVIGLFANGDYSLANVFDIDDLVLAVGEETGNAGVSFSFDEIAPNEIVLSPDYDETQITWKYSLDRGLNWFDGEGLRKKLSEPELASLSKENDLVVKITDLINQEEREFVVDITKHELPENLYVNDFENRLFGSTSKLEWSIDGINWTSFNAALPNLGGDVNLMVRIPASGTALGSEVKTFAFSKDEINETRKYVSLSKLSVDKYSSEDPSFPINSVLDGNGLNYWKTLSTDSLKFLTISITKPIYLSGIDYIGNIKEAKISASMDGINWTLVATSDLKSITLDSSVLTKYVKIEALSTDNDEVLSLSQVNLFEDNTKRVLPKLKVSYDTVELTRGNVIAQLLDVGENIRVTSEGGLVHLFTENGTFKFTYENELGMSGEVIASVDWIDRVSPTASIKYEKTSTGGVKATLVDESEFIEITNNGGNRSYTFNKNGTFEFIFKDLAGNEGRVLASVDSITTKKPSPSVKPSKPVENKPSTSKPSVDKDEKPVENDKPSTDKEPEKPTEVKVSNSFTINNVSIEVLGDKLTIPLALKMDTKELTKTLKPKVGKGSTFFELYFVDGDGDRVTISQNYKMILKLDSDKIFKDVYKVDGDKLTKLEYTTRGAKEIEIDIDALSNYIVSYDTKDENKKGASAFDYIVALLLAMLLAVAAVVVYRRTR
ncbi:MAG TPA: hypothetical protein DCY94_01880 [Firmicutes bacterium]|nr:hypothetical protein [Bacillota bacterium]